MLAARLLPSDLGYLVQSEWPWAYIRDRVVGHLRAPCQGTGPHSAAGPAPGHFNTGDSTFQLPVQACTLRARCSDETKRLPSPSPAAVMWPGVARIRFPHRYLPWAGIWLLEHNHVAFHMLAGCPRLAGQLGKGFLDSTTVPAAGSACRRGRLRTAKHGAGSRKRRPSASGGAIG